MHGTEYDGESLAETISSMAALLIGHFCGEGWDEESEHVCTVCE